ncbi:dihydroorotase [Thioalkalivibrio sp. HK1]|uniref:dihydroorotase n=1 Tax=Thioalkalivibrio sp. HK1 TaxID=1469245 RepID=UPI000471C572|nr:dihydroorotase [Thioalkalivibrio sp. HK1]
MNEITLIRPDDWHVHFRDGPVLADVVPASAARFGRVVVMPNLVPPVTTAAAAQAYRRRILSTVPGHPSFNPLMTLYLTESTRPAEVRKAARCGADFDCPVIGFKFYPAGATTHSDQGVNDIARCYAALEAMQEEGLALLIHGEVVLEEVDIFDRERIFVERVLAPLVERFPALKVVLEHVTTADGVDFVRRARKGVAATITAHHLLLNRNALFEGGLRPHHYCLPVLKRERHRLALVEAASSGSERFFLGTDSAPHPKHAKESACGCAGIYTAHAGIELYAEVFEGAGALDHLEAFASRNGPDFYGLPVNEESMVLHKKAWSVPRTMPIGEEDLIPFRAGSEVAWQVAPR